MALSDKIVPINSFGIKNSLIEKLKQMDIISNIPLLTQNSIRTPVKLFKKQILPNIHSSLHNQGLIKNILTIKGIKTIKRRNSEFKE